MEGLVPFHVRTLIKTLNYDVLLSSKIIPDVVWEHITSNCGYTLKFPMWVIKQKSFSAYGLFIDFLIKKMLKHEEWKSRVFDIATEAFESLGFEPPKREDVSSRFGTYISIYKWISLTLPEGEAQFDEECIFGNIQGHPDIVVGEYVLDIKTTSNFDKMQKETILQLVSYFSLLKRLGRNVTYIGVVLPFQQEMLLYKMPPEFDHTLFLEKLCPSQTPQVNIVSNPIMNVDILANLLSTLVNNNNLYAKYNVGSHIPKKSTITLSLKNLVENGDYLSCQMFLGSPVSCNRAPITKRDVREAKEIIKNYKLNYYTHASYLINLCDPSTKKSINEKHPHKVIMSLLRRDVRVTNKIGGKGVVVHTGKSKNLGVEKGLSEMVKYIKSALVCATPECPLLLETGARQGTELLCDVEDLYTFMRGDRFTPEEKAKFFVCVDTCHVWASGYDPDEYITRLTSLSKEEQIIRLVHFNNSKVDKSSCKDRHAPLYEGKIPLDIMENVLIWCQKNNVPTVIE